MKITWTTRQLENATNGILAIPFRQGAKNRAFADLDKATSGALSEVAKQERFKGQKGQLLTWQGKHKGTAKHIVVFGLGKEPVRPATWRSSLARTAAVASRHRLNAIAVLVDKRDPPQEAAEIRWSVEALNLAAYRFDRYKSKKQITPLLKEGKIGVHPKATDANGCRDALRAAKAISAGVILARDLVNEPANVLSPAVLAQRAEELAAREGLGCTILDEAALRQKKMNLLLAVAAGSTRKPYFIHLTYKPERKNADKVVLVGKGLTFDSGGLCLKQPKSMADMKTDMAGAAVVLGVMSSLRVLKPRVEVHGIIPTTDNAIGGNATRPGDVIESLSDVSVEIVNTDAEGRLILADALCYARDLKPKIIIDHATLTGACVVALGLHTAGLFANRDQDAQAYLAAANEADELLWRLPLTQELEPDLRSDVADVKNVGGRWGGAITAALFLKKFVKEDPWLHVDIAGPARSEKNTPLCPRGGSGFGVMTACAYLKSL